MITDPLSTLIVAWLKTQSGSMSSRKLALIKSARAAYPGLPVNAAIWAALRNAPVAPPTNLTYQGAVIADAPVGYWNLNDAFGVDAFDQAVASNDGVYSNDVATWIPRTPTPVNGGFAISCDGVLDRRMTVSPLPAYNLGAGPGSIELWFKVPTPPLDPGILFKVVAAGGLDIWQFAALTSGSLQLDRRNAAGANLTIPVSGKLDDAWHHLVVTVGGGSIRVYVDTTLISTQADLAGPFGVAATIDFGGNRIGPSNMLKGMLDEIAFYATALTQLRITAHYNARV